jgi:hypothetical protein
VGLKLNGTHQLLADFDDVNLLGDNIDTIKKNTETLTDSSKEICIEINVEKTKYMLLSNKQTNKQTPWSESASELYRPSDRRLSAK